MTAVLLRRQRRYIVADHLSRRRFCQVLGVCPESFICAGIKRIVPLLTSCSVCTMALAYCCPLCGLSAGDSFAQHTARRRGAYSRPTSSSSNTFVAFICVLVIPISICHIICMLVGTPSIKWNAREVNMLIWCIRCRCCRTPPDVFSQTLTAIPMPAVCLKSAVSSSHAFTLVKGGKRKRRWEAEAKNEE